MFYTGCVLDCVLHKGFVDLFYDFWIQKLNHFYNFWIQIFFCPFLQFLVPETALFLQFLDTETAPFLRFLGDLWIVGGSLPSPCGGPYGS